jgi:hypothetical protein
MTWASSGMKVYMVGEGNAQTWRNYSHTRCVAGIVTLLPASNLTNASLIEVGF